MKYLNILFLLVALNVFATEQTAPQIVNEPDQTDIFAIPIDEDAEEQQEELDEFENYKK